MKTLSFKNFYTEKYGLQYHDNLNPKLFDGDIVKDAVRTKLLSYANMFRDYCNISPSLVTNIYMTGGNCNYNYTDKSDIDVHIVLDRVQLGSPLFIDDFLWDKKYMFSINYPIVVEGYTLEPYVQDIHETFPKGQGVYSLQDNGWIQKPLNMHIDFDSDISLNKKIKNNIRMINHAIKKNASIDELQSLKKKITSIRGSAIARDGEFAQDNVVFKALRNTGYLELIDKKIKEKQKESNFGI